MGNKLGIGQALYPQIALCVADDIFIGLACAASSSRDRQSASTRGLVGLPHGGG